MLKRELRRALNSQIEPKVAVLYEHRSENPESLGKQTSIYIYFDDSLPIYAVQYLDVSLRKGSGSDRRDAIKAKRSKSKLENMSHTHVVGS